MDVVGMPEAARRLNVSPDSAKRTLQRAGVTLSRVNKKAWVVHEADLARVIAEREGYSGRGRPRGTDKAKGEEAGG